MKNNSKSDTQIANYPENFAEMTYEGKPLPKWLQKPAYQEQSKENSNQIPEWLQKPAII